MALSDSLWWKISTKWFWIFKHVDGQVERPLQLHIHLITLYKRTHKNSVTILLLLHLPNILLLTDKQIICTQTSTDNLTDSRSSTNTQTLEYGVLNNPKVTSERIIVIMWANILYYSYTQQTTSWGMWDSSWLWRLLSEWFSFIYPDDGSIRFLCNIVIYSPDYIASHSVTCSRYFKAEFYCLL